jgi:hypothetical protein
MSTILKYFNDNYYNGYLNLIKNDNFLKIYYNMHNIIIIKSYIQKYSDNFIKNLIFLYGKLFTTEELTIINNKLFTVNIQSNMQSNNMQSNNYRNEILIPCFYHYNTIFFLNNLKIENPTIYLQRLNLFFDIKNILDKELNFFEKQGCFIESSTVLAIFDIRFSKDLDLLILTTDNPKYKKLYEKLKQINYLDLFMPRYINWENEDINILNNFNKQVNYPPNFYQLVLDPQYHFYFYGYKINTIFLDLKYRKLKLLPKKYADLILFQKKYNFYKINLPFIPQTLTIGDKKYTRKKYFDIVNYHLKNIIKPDYQLKIK